MIRPVSLSYMLFYYLRIWK